MLAEPIPWSAQDGVETGIEPSEFEHAATGPPGSPIATVGSPASCRTTTLHDSENDSSEETEARDETSAQADGESERTNAEKGSAAPVAPPR